MPRPNNSFDQLGGVPVHYDRFNDPNFGYGTRGKPTRFHCTEAFEQKLDTCFQELWTACPLGKAEVITSAGAFVEKPGKHGEGRAFDLDGLFWSDKTFITLRYPQDRQFYLGVEAILRKHFGTVLNYEYNASHRDHFHVDDGTAVGFSSESRSRVLFLQMVLTHVFAIPVGIDGVIGRETNDATRELLVQLGLANASEITGTNALHQKLNSIWLRFLNRVAQESFSRAASLISAAEKNPLQLLQDVYKVIGQELHNDARRKTIETALTAFAQDEDTAQWLEQFGS